MKFINYEKSSNPYMSNSWWTTGTYVRVWGCVILGVILAITMAVVGIRGISRHMSQEACNHYATANGRPTKFVTYTYWSWDCLTPNAKAPGTWISNSNPTLVGQ